MDDLPVFDRQKHVWEKLDYVVECVDDITSPLTGTVYPIDTTKTITVKSTIPGLTLDGVTALNGETNQLTAIGFFAGGGRPNLTYPVILQFQTTNGALIEQMVGLRVIP